MPHQRRAACTVVAAVAAAMLSVPASGGQSGSSAQAPRDGDRKPSLSLRATPPIGFTPLRVRAVAEVRGGADDYADLYCTSVEWDWGDGTVSENSEDCDPYEAGKSAIRRRYSGEHTYRTADNYKVQLRLKQKSRVVASSQFNIAVRPGAREGF